MQSMTSGVAARGDRRREFDEEVERLLAALLEGDWRTADAVLRAGLARGLKLHALGDLLIAPALHRVGDLWEAGRLNVAQEHVATATAQAALALATAHMEAVPRHSGRALFACVAKNRHALGVRVVADAFEDDGWRVRYLGPDVPTGDLVRDIAAWRPHVVGLSVAMPEHEAAAAEAVRAIRHEFEENSPRILLGGLAVNADPHLVTRVGADGAFPDADSVDRAPP